MRTEVDKFIKRLKKYTEVLTRQQVNTLRGQALSGNIPAAEKGLERLLILISF